MGVVAILAPQDSGLLGLVSVIAPAIVSGNACVVVASERCPLPAVTLGEVLATSDVPGGVVNILTGFVAEIAPWLASHMDVNAIDITGAPGALADDGGGRGGQPQASRPPPGHRLGGRAGDRANDVLSRDEDSLAPCRAIGPFLTERKLSLFFCREVSRNQALRLIFLPCEPSNRRLRKLVVTTRGGRM